MMFPLHTLGDDSQDNHLFVVSGVLVNSGTSKNIESFVSMIEEKTGYKLKPFYVNSYDRLSQTLRLHPDALAWTCGAPYVQDHIRDKQQLVAVPLFKNKPLYHSFIVSRKDDLRTKLSDFKGGLFVYSDLRSNSGYFAPSVLLKNLGFDIDHFFRVKILAGTHEQSIESLRKGLADVAAIDEYVWVEYVRMHPEVTQILHVIEKLGPFPFTPIVAGRSVKKETIVKVQKALTQMTPVELKSFKKHFNMDGFVLKKSTFYKPTLQMLEKLGQI